MTTPVATPLNVPAITPPTAIRGRFLWYELMTTDPEDAQRFYPAVLGWTLMPFDKMEGPEPYIMWAREGSPLGGTMKISDEMKAQGVSPHWLAYIGSDDVDATAAKVKELGGKVYMEPFDVPTVGRMAVLADPMGAVFAVYRPESGQAAPDEPPKVGEFSWHELVTTDYKAAFDFYQTLFGWELAEDSDMGEMGVYRQYARNGRQLGGMFNKMPGMEQIPPSFNLYIRVDDVAAAVERVKENGGMVTNGPMEVPGGDMIANCLDPQGAAFSLHQAKAK
jgi:uncharacterized protein